MHVTRHKFCLLIIKALCSRFVFLLGELILSINVTQHYCARAVKRLFLWTHGRVGVSSHQCMYPFDAPACAPQFYYFAHNNIHRHIF